MNKVNYEPVIKTGVLSSSIYEDGNIITFGGKTHLSLIKDSEHKFAALEVVGATDKDGNSCILNPQECEDGNFAVFAISTLKKKKVFSADNVNSTRRLSGGMNVSEILSLEEGVQYKLVRTKDGFKKPFGWTEGDSLQENYSYRLEPVVAVQSPQPTPKNK